MTHISKLAALMILGTAEVRAERRLVISIPDRRLALLVDGEVKKVYAVAVGKPRTPSPAGTFTVVTRVPQPTWYGPKKIVKPGKDNPLGTRWIGLSQKGYGVHGTNAPRSIGKAASHGCIRMRNEDVEELFEQVQAGDTVELMAERNETVAAVFGKREPAPAPQLDRQAQPPSSETAETRSAATAGGDGE